MSKDYYIIRDPVHGFIKFNGIERDIINAPPFQRLRYIRQLALTYLVYPGAEHSRFSHSLGVMEFATKVYDTLIAKHRADIDWNQDRIKRNRQLLRLAALLHDLGHAPFSHASDDLFENGMDHEKYSEKLILTPPIKDIINQLPDKGINVTSMDVSSLLSGENIDADGAFLKEIYTGEIDVDKMDYLLRDSLFTGVHYGRFDHDRLINTLCLIQTPNSEDVIRTLAVEEGGLHALEALVLARYFMFTQVYFHRVRRSYDHHLENFLKIKLGHYPLNLDDYLTWDDNKVLGLLKEATDNEDARCILTRNHYVEAFNTPEHTDSEQRTRFKWMSEKVIEEFPDVKCYIDEAEKAPHKFQKVDFYVKKRDRGEISLVTKESKIINSLQNIEQYRIFVSRENRDQVKTFCDKFWLQNQG